MSLLTASELPHTPSVSSQPVSGWGSEWLVLAAEGLKEAKTALKALEQLLSVAELWPHEVEGASESQLNQMSLRVTVSTQHRLFVAHSTAQHSTQHSTQHPAPPLCST